MMTIANLPVSLPVKNYENRLEFDKVTGKGIGLVACFLTYVVVNQKCFTL